MKYLIFKILPLAVCLHATLAAHPDKNFPDNASELRLDDVLRAVAEKNAALRAARAKWEASRKRVPQEAAWDDLRIDASQTLHRFPNEPRDAMTDTELMFEQALPVSGKNRSRARAASAESVAAFEEMRRAELEALRRARVAFVNLANVCAQLEFNRQNQSLLG